MDVDDHVEARLACPLEGSDQPCGLARIEWLAEGRLEPLPPHREADEARSAGCERVECRL